MIAHPDDRMSVQSQIFTATSSGANGEMLVQLPLPQPPSPASPADLDASGSSSPTSLPTGGQAAASTSSTIAERRVWTAEEDAQIAALVAAHGTRSWSVIAAQLPTRTGKQCRERWHNHLNPEVTKESWTAEEDARILSLHQQ